MTARRAYLDYNATAPLRPEAREAMIRALDVSGNPSSVHAEGRAARALVETARERIAVLVNARPADVVFMSGATEANNAVLAAGWDVVALSGIEHDSVRAPAARHAGKVGTIVAAASGLIDVADVAAVIAGETSGRRLMAVQLVNNETGVIQPVMRIGEMCRAAGVPFVCDATQWVGKMITDVEQTPIDLLCMSAHKFHGPKGVGALYARRGIGLEPVIHGTQERERRGGTENVPGILGMGVAAELAAEWLLDSGARSKLAALRDRFEKSILENVPGTSVNGTRDSRLWNTSNIAFAKLEAEALLLLLSERGVCASAGAACSSGSLDPSPVLLAMNVPEQLAHGSLRFSLSRDTTQADVDGAAVMIAECVQRLRGSSSKVIS